MASMLQDRVQEMRAFTRFYTAEVGALDEGLVGTQHSLPEARVIWELAQHAAVEVVQLRRDLDLDSGYLSRILQRLDADGLVARDRSPDDARKQVVRLTSSGRAAYAALDGRTAEQTRARLGSLDQDDQVRLLDAMATIRSILEPIGAATPLPLDAADRRSERVVLRAPKPGELGWIVEAHGRVYAQEFGWDERFEALVARVVADYAADHDEAAEACWIADLDGQPVGSIFCIRVDDRTAKLRLLLVDHPGRGLGIGERLVQECVRFAREAGYDELVFWTNSPLVAARTIYDREGFRLVAEEAHSMFGPEVVGQDFELDLR
jgi:DNA-binding MarR family transcriptional regulator/GNAT superfamily N-acetyltransferase